MTRPAAEQLFNAGGKILEKVLKLENPPFFFRDDRVESLSQQGEYLPLVIGRRRIAPVHAWSGVTIPSPFPVLGVPFMQALVEGGFSISGLLDGQDAFYEPGIHALCIGPVRKIHMIYQDGVAVLRFPGFESFADIMDSASVPSGFDPVNNFFAMFDVQLSDMLIFAGSLVHPFLGSILEIALPLFGLGDVGIDPVGWFSIYWGENEQPGIPSGINEVVPMPRPVLPVVTSDYPRFPYVCYIHYILKFLGPSAQWQSMQYDVEVRPYKSRLVKSSAWFDATSETDGNLNFLEDSGANPAHALCQLLNAPFPHGLGLAEEWIDFDSLEKLGQICEAEHFPVNIYAKDGIDAIEQITQLLDEVGVSARQIGRQLNFMAIREPDEADVIDVTEDARIIPDPDQEIDHSDPYTTAEVQFYDRDKDYRQRSLAFDDDGLASLGHGPAPVPIELENVTDARTAEKTLYRRSQEVLSGGAVTSMVLGRVARDFHAGQPITLEPFGAMRVVSVKPEGDSAATHVTARLDNYSIPPLGFLLGDDVDNFVAPDGNPAALEDAAFDWMEAPPLYLREALDLFIMRIPSDENSRNANAYGSADDVTYYSLGNSNSPVSGGTLVAEIEEDDQWFLDAVAIDLVGYVMNVDDLTGQDDQWRNGVQWAVIGNEILFLQSATEGSGDVWTLNNLIRGRFGTAREAHPAGSQVYILRQDAIAFLMHETMSVDDPYYIKTQPVSRLGGAVDLADVTAVNHTLLGNFQRPARPGNFKANTATVTEPHNRNKYRTGEAIVFTWSYSTRAGFGVTAGTQDAGEVVPNSDVPAEGSWKVEIFNGTVLERTLTASVTTVTYSNAALVADFGSEPASFTAVLTEVNGLLESDSVTITVEKVT